MQLTDWLAILGGVATVVSIVVAVIFYYRGELTQQKLQAKIDSMNEVYQQRSRDLRAHLHSAYNQHFLIARACARFYDFVDKKLPSVAEGGRETELLVRSCREIEKIAGAADAARSALISFARESVQYEVWYEHPAFPGKKDMPVAVVYGGIPGRVAHDDSESTNPEAESP